MGGVGGWTAGFPRDPLVGSSVGPVRAAVIFLAALQNWDLYSLNMTPTKNIRLIIFVLVALPITVDLRDLGIGRYQMARNILTGEKYMRDLDAIGAPERVGRLRLLISVTRAISNQATFYVHHVRLRWTDPEYWFDGAQTDAERDKRLYDVVCDITDEESNNTKTLIDLEVSAFFTGYDEHFRLPKHRRFRLACGVRPRNAKNMAAGWTFSRVAHIKTKSTIAAYPGLKKTEKYRLVPHQQARRKEHLPEDATSTSLPAAALEDEASPNDVSETSTRMAAFAEATVLTKTSKEVQGNGIDDEARQSTPAESVDESQIQETVPAEGESMPFNQSELVLYPHSATLRPSRILGTTTVTDNLPSLSTVNAPPSSENDRRAPEFFDSSEIAQSMLLYPHQDSHGMPIGPPRGSLSKEVAEETRPTSSDSKTNDEGSEETQGPPGVVPSDLSLTPPTIQPPEEDETTTQASFILLKPAPPGFRASYKEARGAQTHQIATEAGPPAARPRPIPLIPVDEDINLDEHPMPAEINEMMPQRTKDDYEALPLAHIELLGGEEEFEPLPPIEVQPPAPPADTNYFSKFRVRDLI